MTKEIKKQYNLLDLPYSANEEEVKTREKALIKVLRAKNIYKGENNKEKILKVVRASEEILNYIKNNGIPEEDHHFITETSSLISQFFVMLIIGIIAVVSLMCLL